MPDERKLEAKPKTRRAYTRVIRTQPITFTCGECDREVTEEQYPGAAPKWCYACRREVKRRQQRERVRRHRAKKRGDA